MPSRGCGSQQWPGALGVSGHGPEASLESFPVAISDLYLGSSEKGPKRKCLRCWARDNEVLKKCALSQLTAWATES